MIDFVTYSYAHQDRSLTFNLYYTFVATYKLYIILYYRMVYSLGHACKQSIPVTMSLCIYRYICQYSAPYTCQPIYVVNVLFPVGMMWTIYNGGCEPAFYRSSEVIWSTPTSPDDVMPTLNYSSNCLLLLDYILYK